MVIVGVLVRAEVDVNGINGIKFEEWTVDADADADADDDDDDDVEEWDRNENCDVKGKDVLISLDVIPREFPRKLFDDDAIADDDNDDDDTNNGKNAEFEIIAPTAFMDSEFRFTAFGAIGGCTTFSKNPATFSTVARTSTGGVDALDSVIPYGWIKSFFERGGIIFCWKDTNDEEEEDETEDETEAIEATEDDEVGDTMEDTDDSTTNDIEDTEGGSVAESGATDDDEEDNEDEENEDDDNVVNDDTATTIGRDAELVIDDDEEEEEEDDIVLLCVGGRGSGGKNMRGCDGCGGGSDRSGWSNTGGVIGIMCNGECCLSLSSSVLMTSWLSLAMSTGNEGINWDVVLVTVAVAVVVVDIDDMETGDVEFRYPKISP